MKDGGKIVSIYQAQLDQEYRERKELADLQAMRESNYQYVLARYLSQTRRYND